MLNVDMQFPPVIPGQDQVSQSADSAEETINNPPPLLDH